MNPITQLRREELRSELKQLQAAAELAAVSASHLNGIALNPEAQRADLVPESSVVRDIAALLKHAVLNLTHSVAREDATLKSAHQAGLRGYGKARVRNLSDRKLKPAKERW